MTTNATADSSAPDPERLAAARAALAAATSSEPSQGATASGEQGDGGDKARSGEGSLEVSTVGTPHLRAVKEVDASQPGGDQPSRPGIAEARQIALRQLAMGPRSRHQLTEKMTARRCQPEDIVSVLDRMTDVGLVDDAAYAEMFVRTKREGSGLATSALRHELRKKGVPQHIADQAVTSATADDERSRAQELVRVRLGRMAGLDRDVQMRRLAGFLARKGYPSGVALAVIREAIDALPEHQRD